MPSKTSKRPARKSKRRPAAKPATPHVLTPIYYARLAQVFMWIVQGNTRTYIAESIAAQWPELDAETLIAAAFLQLEQSATVNVAQERGWCIEAYRELHRRLTEMGDYAAAIRAVSKLEAIVESQRKDKEAAENDDAGETTETEQQARAHLAPLFKGGDKLPLVELARLAAGKILNQSTT